MIHHYVSENGDHYAVAPNADHTHILLQVQEGDQARIRLTVEQALHLVGLLTDAIRKVATA